MRAIRYYGPGDVRQDEVPVPEISRSELLVKVYACAVCGSDLKAFNFGNPRLHPPITMGHEFTGEIVEVGRSTTGFQKGERIVLSTSISCGECLYCRKGCSNLCVNLAPMGFFYNGGMAEYVAIPENAINNGHIVKVPDSLKPEFAALAEPLSCAVNSIAKCNIQEGDTVLIMGAGPMGILNACAARRFGAGKIIITELNGSRLLQARDFDIDLLVDPGKEDLKEIVLSQTDGYGADIVIVAAPAASPQEEALSLVRKGGTVCLFASLPSGQSNLSIDSRLIHYGEINLTGSSDSTTKHVEIAVEMLSDPEFPAGKIASHILSLNDLKTAFSLMSSGEALRVVLIP
ncbi:MAG: alcohol dehydrogenase catalytic domain-containing protein [Bacteroidetes bacterium]|nr:alcohol dehydrogenase catalytic domain-containing protein [Bacteroidota bacterium]